jgi:hypothetical protein
MNAVVLLATTDRPEACARLCADLAAAAATLRQPLTVGIVENSRTARSRTLNRLTFERLTAQGIDLVIADARPGGLPIGVARTRQRELLRGLVQQGRRPAMVWMLDDDLRLQRLVVRDGVLRREPLHDPIGRLLGLAGQTATPDVLIGTVHGDPPIPAMATWASRVADLGANLHRMGQCDPEQPWTADAATCIRLCEPDYYYDYGQHPRLDTPALWLPRQPGQTVRAACEAMLEDACHLPLGIGFTRPLISFESTTSDPPPSINLQGSARVRGGNAVFFDLEACLAHDYPTAELAGVRTRRGDSVGLHLLRRHRGVTFAASDFAVLHGRDDHATPCADPNRLLEHLLADTLGAALTRAVEGHDHPALSRFLQHRVAQVEHHLRRLHTAIQSLHCPAWLGVSGPGARLAAQDGPIAWLQRHVPGLTTGRIPTPARERLLAPELVDELIDQACTWSR